jgi:autotransporter-associated beta strand protein
LTIIRSGDNVIISDANERFAAAPAGGTLSADRKTLTIPLSAFTGQILVNAEGGDDTLDVQLTGGNSLSSGITFNGGAGSDALTITGGSQGNVTYNYTNAHDGSVVMSAFGTIAYTGLEPLTNSGSATDIIFNLPAGGNPDATLANHATAGSMQLTGSTFENTTFAVPSGSLTLNGGSGADTISLASADAAFGANLFVNGGGNTDAVNVTGSFNAGAGNVTIGGLSDVETIGVSGSLVTTGTVALSASGNVSIAAGGINNSGGSGAVSVTSTGGTVQVGGNGIQSSSTISVTAGQNAAVSSLNTPGLVRVTAINGGVTDAGGGMDITAGSVALRAAAGIGSGNALETTVTNLAAINTTSGDIRIDNTGALFITNVDSLSGVTNQAAGGEIVVTASSPLTVNSPVLDSGGGDITLAAEGNTAADDLTVNANITASGGDGAIYLYAGDSISLAGSVTVGAAGAGVVLLGAGSDYNSGSPLDGSSSGDVTMASGSVVRSEDGDILLLAPNDVRLSFVNADSNNDNVRGTVTIIADYEGPDAGLLSDNVGAILDNTPGEARNIRAGLAELRAATGIGSGGGDADIDTNIIFLDAVNSTSGDIAVNEVFTGGRLDVEQVIQDGSGSIRLTTENGSLRLLVGGAGVQVNNGGGTVLLDANVLNAAVDEPSRGDVVLFAAVTTGGGAITLDADHDVLSTVAGTISSSGGSIAITADANNAGPAGDQGTIQLRGNLAAGAGTLTFSLADCDGWVGATPGSSSGNVTAANLVLGNDAKPNGEGVLRLQGGANTVSGTTTVVDGTLLVNGVLTGDDVQVQDGGVLGGHGNGSTTGVINGNIDVASGGILDPGDYLNCTPQTGRLTVNLPPEGAVDIRSGGTFRVQLAGLTAGATSGGYDQLVVNGTTNVRLYGSLINGAGGGTLLVEPQFGVPVGAEFRIIDNDDTDPITSRFLGLPEGAFLYPGGVLMNISYRSGSNNNDVTLTAPGRYDFNGVNGYTAAHYMPVSPYTAKSGANSAGWQTLPPRYFERNWPVLPPYTSEGERLKYDGHSTDREGNPLTFEVDVVAGKRYEVMILTGDVTWNHDRMRFDVYDANGPLPPLTPTLPYTQVVDTWGAGAPDGSGVLVTWGGGDANTSGTGFYRWIRFTTDAILDPGDGLGTLLMTMQDLGGWDPTTVILAMDIRPVETVGEIEIERTDPAETPEGVPLSFTSLAADGMTVDTYAGSGAPPHATLTVTVTAGTPLQYAAASPDGDATFFGTQVTANQFGHFTFSVLRPATLTDTSAAEEDWTILVEEVSGLSRGTALQPYAAPEETAPLRFDFGTSGSPVQTDFLPVIPQTTYNATRGYGWMSRVAGANRQDPSMSALRTDLNYASDATFKVDLPDGNYSVRIYHSNPKYYGVTTYIADNFQVYAEGVVQYTIANIPAGTTDIRTFSVSVSGGALELRFQDLGGWDRNFVVSGIDISAGTLPGVAPLLASGNPLDSGAAAITTADLTPVVAEATAQWLATGLTPAQAATLQSARVTVADLGGAYLGLANPATNAIRIDNDAAMLGWSVVRGPSSVVNGGVDLLTVVMHEMGHLLGYDHSDDADDLMAPVLSVGTRYAPAADTHDSRWVPGSSPSLLPSSSLVADPSSTVDDLFAELVQESDDDGTSELLEANVGDLLAARTAKSGERAAQARVPRRSRMERYERELDAWFAELVAAEEGVEG